MPKKKFPWTVVVTGDVTMDWNLARKRRSNVGAVAWNSDGCTRAYWLSGGAALLADLIEAIAEQLEAKGRFNYSISHEMAAIGNVTLPEKEKKKDRVLIRSISKILAQAGYSIG